MILICYQSSRCTVERASHSLLIVFYSGDSPTKLCEPGFHPSGCLLLFIDLFETSPCISTTDPLHVMQQGGVYAPSRHRSPNHSDTEGDVTDSQSAETGLTSNAATSANLIAPPRPQRPVLSHATTPSGSFMRIKRKNTSAVDTNVNHAASVSTSAFSRGERTVEQLTSKTCFICYEDETEENKNGKKWIHPCKCSLVAHEDCLLSWITVSKPKTSKKMPVACPQCSTPYTINQVDFPLLNLVERVEDAWARNVSKILMVGLGAGAWTLLSWYGIWAFRMFAGSRVTEQCER